jgi:hypothetical protein
VAESHSGAQDGTTREADQEGGVEGHLLGKKG